MNPKQPKTAWLFDVDGVLADPKHKKVDSEFYDIILNKLQKGEPVGLNTGRSIEWVIEKLIDPLREKIADKYLLSQFIAVGEKGGTWMTFDTDGTMQKQKEKSFVLSSDLREKVKKLVEDHYSDCAIFDDTKETMISVEMKDGYEIGEFTKRQKQLNEDMKRLINKYGNGHKLDPTIIATDIEDVRVGKALGADRFLQWLQDKEIKPEKFVAFGDSVSDLEMADELGKQGKKVTFVYVGDAEKLEEAKNEGKVKDPSVIRTVGNFTQGTLRYLEGS